MTRRADARARLIVTVTGRGEARSRSIYFSTRERAARVKKILTAVVRPLYRLIDAGFLVELQTLPPKRHPNLWIGDEDPTVALDIRSAIADAKRIIWIGGQR